MIFRRLIGIVAALGVGAAFFTTAGRAESDLDRIIAGDNALGVALMQRLAGGSTNLVVSPTSIGNVMAMAVAGARGTTRDEMRHVLGTALEPAENAAARRRLGALLTDRKKADSPELVISAALHLTRHGDLVAPSFRQEMGLFGAQLFSGSDLDQINGWVSSRTNGRIASILQRLDPNSVCVLLNATYFKGAWQTPFSRKRTGDAPFQLIDGSTAQVATMKATGAFRELRAHTFLVVSLPYRDSSLAMVVFLPMWPSAMEHVMALSASSIRGLIAEVGNSAPGRRDLWLPKFTVSSGADLIPPLQALGMKLAFDRDRANFSAITGSTDEARRLHISQVQTRAFVAVDEVGTEAAASTAVEFAYKSAPPSDVIKIERPFVFVIADTSSGAIVFTGRVMDPRR